jgi:hypothetical protein
VFAPLGITRDRPGKSLRAGARRGAVLLPVHRPSVFDAAGTTVPAPYGSFNVENRTAMGGWLTTAVDYVRFTQYY